MNLLDFIVLALATWRISSLLVDEPGPFNMFIRLRELTGITHDADGIPLVIPDGLFSDLFSCVWCMSIWIGLFLTILFLCVPNFLYLATPFALSAVAIKLHPR